MKTKLWPLFIGLVVLILAACGNAGKDSGSNDDIPQLLEVQLEVQESADVNEMIPFKALVTQGDEKISDADEVEFEIWEEGKKEDSEMLEAKNNKDGTYEAEKAFEHDGVFTVQVHVTARGLHTMPKKSVTVGEGASDDHDHGDHEHGDHDHGEHSHTEGFSMHFVEPEGVEKGQETKLVVHLQLEDHPMENARVRYEIWNDDISDKHEWVDAEESVAGEYSANFTFEEAGTYSIQIHVQNDEGLHEHEEHEIEVK
ncbi:FixH family protein [Lederbergia citrea]|uniref:FixH family protein n=1 Tax=Lederbergia citrea TaxID=2833581 RepID=A0A942UT32_9BACI|nr:FixH family protein [Lederbergia citrea]MBS4205998.1 FixH family protein [Lederbergia citrea]MBS4224553.1 FixH family protein [Lederbergia citrea]